MKAQLLHPSSDFDWKWAFQAATEREALRNGRKHNRSQGFDPCAGLPWNAEAISADLSLNTVLEAMAQGDDVVFAVCRRVLLAATRGELSTILYRQEILRDCLKYPLVIRELYATVLETKQAQQAHYLGVLARYPDWVLRDALEAMRIFLVFLRRLRYSADLHAAKFAAAGWQAFFSMLERDLDGDYLALIQTHLDELKFSYGEKISAGLGHAQKGKDYVLLRMPHRKWTLSAWWSELFAEKEAAYRFELHPRDEAGFQALSALRNRGIALAADALGRSAAHVRDFFSMLQAELAFYIGCLNLHEQLTQKQEPVCMPKASSCNAGSLTFQGLYDIGLALTMAERVVGNDVSADKKNLIIITGPNTGGKSTFLRSVGLAQLMMQAGMFVPAEHFSASLCDGLLTHYKREEDSTMRSGKFDEELSRMSVIVDHVDRHSWLLLNESLASTNEREGSEIARQMISALMEHGVRIFCVTHMYELAHGFYGTEGNEDMLFLRADRTAGGARTFKIIEGKPLPTSFGADLYQKIFACNEPHRPGESGTASAVRIPVST
jgi:hypothetical protein